MIQCKINFQKIFYLLCIPLYLSSTFLVDASPRPLQYDRYGYAIANGSTIEQIISEDIESTDANRATIIYADIAPMYETIEEPIKKKTPTRSQAKTLSRGKPLLSLEDAQMWGPQMRAGDILPTRTPSKQSGCSAHMKRNKKRYSVAASVAALLLTGGIAAASWWGGAFSGNEIQSVPDPKFAVDTGIIFTGNTPVKPTVKQCDSSLPKAIANGMTVDMRDPQYCDSSTAWTCWTEYLSGCKVVGEYLTDCLWKLIPSHAHQYATYDITCHRTSKKFRVLIERDNRAARLTRYSEVLDVYPNE